MFVAFDGVDLAVGGVEAGRAHACVDGALGHGLGDVVGLGAVRHRAVVVLLLEDRDVGFVEVVACAHLLLCLAALLRFDGRHSSASAAGWLARAHVRVLRQLVVST